MTAFIYFSSLLPIQYLITSIHSFISFTHSSLLLSFTIVTSIVFQFAIILSLVLVLEVAAAIAAYSLRAQVAGVVGGNLREAMPHYYDNLDVRDSFDFVQSRVGSVLSSGLLA